VPQNVLDHHDLHFRLSSGTTAGYQPQINADERRWQQQTGKSAKARIRRRCFPLICVYLRSSAV